MEYLYAFERLDVWQVSRTFVKDIYVLLRTFPDFEAYNITSQIRRAAVSVSLNIAEGSTRNSLKEQSRFTEIAYGSLLEVYCSLLLAKDLNYIREDDFRNVSDKIKELSNKLNALKNSQARRSKTQQINNSTDKQLNK
ncbi:four helix bundle protein [Tannerella forsythia]|mgnify:CR=1 FL=1|jgi:S23 ribosomal protein.|uniref:Four helix bundle protein n=2 Tax=Tannerella forsythia TaxID=28112 RepID=A0A2A6E7D6_TANFO|nr:four helix bundle protein [Tannerella forsythia]PDP43390.1 four helix bundle protein [Tannerella forsythia]